MESALDHPDRRLASTRFLLRFWFFLRFMARDTLRTWPSTSRFWSLFHKVWWWDFSLIFGLNFSVSLFHRTISSLHSHLPVILSVALTACKCERNSMTCSWILDVSLTWSAACSVLQDLGKWYWLKMGWNWTVNSIIPQMQILLQYKRGLFWCL